MTLSEALEKIVEETCASLESDRASVFLYNAEQEQLWTKVAKGSDKTITIPYNTGIAGQVFQNDELINIPNAYQDERFN